MAYRTLSCVPSDIQDVFSPQCGYSNTRTSPRALDRTGNCQTLNRQMRRIPPWAKALRVCEHPPTPLHPLCVTHYMCHNTCMHPGVYERASVSAAPWVCWCEDRRWGFVMCRARSLLESVAVSLSRKVDRVTTEAWTGCGLCLCVWELCVLPCPAPLRIHPGT